MESSHHHNHHGLLSTADSPGSSSDTCLTKEELLNHGHCCDSPSPPPRFIPSATSDNSHDTIEVVASCSEDGMSETHSPPAKHHQQSSRAFNRRRSSGNGSGSGKGSNSGTPNDKSSSSASSSSPPTPKNPLLVERCNCEELRHVICHLETKELWDKFHDLGTEMIITKSGR